MPKQASPTTPTSTALLPDDVSVLALTGEIDATTAQTTRAKALAAVDAKPAALVLDLSGVEFFGSNGIAIVLEAAQRAELRGIRFVVVAHRHVVLRPLQVTGVDARLTIRPSLTAALDDLHRPTTGIPVARSGQA
ncbi:STAS domain-containing protein [Umezawaea sp.]|uniref:STAS domain-containing protein n=1 Tax=Umezawaea sp. TaxID=1955258 RepID=UPI002ED0F707